MMMESENCLAQRNIEPTGELSESPGSARVRAYLFHGSRLFLGVVFLFASYDKILQPQAFAHTVYNYQLLPDNLINLTALILPFLELLLAVFLIGGVWLQGTTVISTGLLAVFMGALIFNLARGLDVHCGCFSTQADDDPAGILTVIRDLSFLIASVYLTVSVYSSDRRRAGRIAPPV